MGLNPFGRVFSGINFGGSNINPIASSASAAANTPSPVNLVSYHYNRNVLNTSVSLGKAKESWDGKVPASYHQQGIGGEGNKKYVSPDGHSEAVFDATGKLVTDVVNMGTYNYADPRNNVTGHIMYDVVPYYIFGNTPNDPTSWYHRILGTYSGNCP
jgi:hypothetical protein